MEAWGRPTLRHTGDGGPHKEGAVHSGDPPLNTVFQRWLGLGTRSGRRACPIFNRAPPVATAPGALNSRS